MSTLEAPVAEKLYPSDLDGNSAYRLKLIMTAANDGAKQAILREQSAQDVLFWLNTFVMTYNPRKTPSTIPFITYKFQDSFILEIVERVRSQKDILVDKSRDMGVTWCVMAIFTWFWQFAEEGSDFLCGSRKEQYVDKIGDMATLMQKVRFIIQEQPRWLWPRGFKLKDNASYMKIINPHTGSAITGEATNENFSRGGRQRAIFFDEFAFWECDQSAWRSSADTTNCRIAVSTPHGFNNHFAKLRHSESIDVKSLHWRLHPEKNDDWYQDECARRNNDSVEISQELDISYEGSESGLLFEWEELNKAKTFDEPLSLDRIVLVLDPATEGEDEAVIYVSNNGSIANRKYIKKGSAEGLAAEVVLIANKHNVQVIIADAIGNDILAIVNLLIKDQKRKIKIIAFKSSEKADNKAKYYNKRAELYHQASDAMKSGNLQVDDDYVLMKQLNATRYETKNGRMIIEPKERIREKIGSSPDRADAWSLIPEALKYTHSRREVEYRDTFRKRKQYDLVPAGSEYGEWPGDNTGEAWNFG